MGWSSRILRIHFSGLNEEVRGKKRPSEENPIFCVHVQVNPNMPIFSHQLPVVAITSIVLSARLSPPTLDAKWWGTNKVSGLQFDWIEPQHHFWVKQPEANKAALIKVVFVPSVAYCSMLDTKNHLWNLVWSENSKYNFRCRINSFLALNPYEVFILK